MKLEMLKDITFTDLTDEDLLPAFRVLWSLRDKNSAADMRQAMGNTIVEGKDLELSKEALNPVFNNIDQFRNRFAYEVTQVPPAGHRAMALVEFAEHSLEIPYRFLTDMLMQAEREGSEEAVYALNALKVFSDDTKPEEKALSAQDAVNRIGWKKAGDLMVHADAFAEVDPTDHIQKGAEAGNTYCCSLMAKRLESEDKDEEAIPYWEIARYSSDPDDAFYYAMTYIGNAYKRVDLERGEQLLVRAALAGSPEAAAHLGKSYLWGLMYAKDKVDFYKAEHYLKMADELGHYDAGYFLGCLYFGFYENEPKDLVNHEWAVPYWEKLAKRGYADALMQIGCFFYNGNVEGYKKNMELAATYFQQAAKGRSSRGALNYAEMVCDKDVDVSNRWAAIASFCIAMGDDDLELANQAKKEFADYYRKGGYFNKDEEWADILDSYELKNGKDKEKNIKKVITDLKKMKAEYEKSHEKETEAKEEGEWGDYE